MFDQPQKSRSLQILEVLRERMVLSEEQQMTFRRQHRGHIGEVYFANLLKKEFHNPCISLHSLNLKIGTSECQIDCLLIFQHDIIPLEIKYFPGDYYFKDNRFFISATDREISNPLLQINRTESLLRDFLISHQSKLNIRPYVIFVHPEYHLYNAPRHEAIIFPGQIKRFIRDLHQIPYQTNSHHHYITEKSKQAHILKSTNELIPSYDYRYVKKGIVCNHCDGFMGMNQTGRRLICIKCKVKEKMEDATIRTIKEFHLLFPNREITISSIFEWYDYVVSKVNIRRILMKHFKLVHKGKYSYYIIND